MSLGFQTAPLKNPNNCTDPYAPSFWLGKPGALTQLRMPDAGWARPSNDHFAVHDMLDGQSVDRSPYVCRQWQFSHQWLQPDVMSVFMEYASRQRGVGPFILVDPQMKNLLTPNQASGTDALHTSEGFSLDTLQNIAFFDFFNRAVSGTWTPSDSGHTWAQDGGVPSEYSVQSNTGIHMHETRNTLLRNRVSGVTLTDCKIRGLTLCNIAPSGDYVRTEAILRFVDVNNFYVFRAHRLVSGAIDLQLIKVVSGVETSITALTSTVTHSAGISLLYDFQIVGTTLSAKIWRDDQSEPVAYEITATDASLASGSPGVASLLPPSNTNTLPYTIIFDNITVTNLVTSSTLSSSTNDSLQGERALGWTMTPPVTGTSSVLHVKSPTGLYGFCIPPTSQSSKNIAFSGYVKLASTSLDASAQVAPNLVFMNGVGSVQSTVSGATLTAVTGTAGTGWQAFCVTGSVPAGQSGVYVEPQFAAVNSTITGNLTFLFDKLQLEIIDGTTCTQWEYGQGQPLVSVRSDSESVPRILRTNMNFICVEVT